MSDSEAALPSKHSKKRAKWLKKWFSETRKDRRAPDKHARQFQGGASASPLPKRYGGRYMVGNLAKPRVRKRKKR